MSMGTSIWQSFYKSDLRCKTESRIETQAKHFETFQLAKA